MQASAGILWNKAELLMVPTKYGCSIRMWHDFTSVSALVRCAIAAQHMPSSFSRDSRQKCCMVTRGSCSTEILWSHPRPGRACARSPRV